MRDYVNRAGQSIRGTLRDMGQRRLLDACAANGIDPREVLSASLNKRLPPYQTCIDISAVTDMPLHRLLGADTLSMRMWAAYQWRDRPKRLPQSLGISRQTFVNWLDGTSEPRVSQLVRFASVLDCDVAWFVDGRGRPW